MYLIPICGEVREREIQREIKQEYEDLWRPLLLLIKDGVLTYTEAMSLTEEEMVRLLIANSMYNEEMNKHLSKKMNK